MDVQHVNVKLFVDGAMSLDPSRFIYAFHEWIQVKAQPELLIDVADYAHVPAGPGVLLIGFEADYSMDNTDNRWGMRYNRKKPLDGSNEDRYLQAISSAARAAAMLEKHFAQDGGLKFSRSEFELFINDRAFAPNTPETLAACKPGMEAVLGKVLGDGAFSLSRHDDPRRRFGFCVQSAGPFDLEKLAGLVPA